MKRTATPPPAETTTVPPFLTGLKLPSSAAAPPMNPADKPEPRANTAASGSKELHTYSRWGPDKSTITNNPTNVSAPKIADMIRDHVAPDFMGMGLRGIAVLECVSFDGQRDHAANGLQ